MVETRPQSLISRVVSAVVVGVTGPLVAWAVAYVTVGDVLNKNVAGGRPVDLGFGSLSSLQAVAVIAYPISCLAVLGAFHLTNARFPVWGFVVTSLFLPFWFQIVNGLDVQSTMSYLAVIGAPAALVRLLMPGRETSVSVTGVGSGPSAQAAPRR